jgi:hypothetical protein
MLRNDEKIMIARQHIINLEMEEYGIQLNKLGYEALSDPMGIADCEQFLANVATKKAAVQAHLDQLLAQEQE